MLSDGGTDGTNSRRASLRRMIGAVVDVATLVVLVFAGVAWWRVRDPAEAHSPAGLTPLMDSVLPQAHLTSEDGGPVSLLDEQQRQATLVFVFRSDCQVCARQKPSWESAALVALKRGVRVLAITGEPQQTNLDTYFSSPLIPIVRSDDPRFLQDMLHVQVVPTTILIDASSRIRFHHQGWLPDTALGKLVAGVVDVKTDQ